jgi:hypothetical protein
VRWWINKWQDNQHVVSRKCRSFRSYISELREGARGRIPVLWERQRVLLYGAHEQAASSYSWQELYRVTNYTLLLHHYYKRQQKLRKDELQTQICIQWQMSVKIACIVITTAAKAMLLNISRPYRMMIIRTTCVYYTVSILILLRDSQHYNFHCGKFITSLRG